MGLGNGQTVDAGTRPRVSSPSHKALLERNAETDNTCIADTLLAAALVVCVIRCAEWIQILCELASSASTLVHGNAMNSIR